MNNQEELHIVDIASGAGHLSATVKEVLPEIAVMHHLMKLIQFYHVLVYI